MGLSNSQYDSIVGGYTTLRLQAKYDQSRRLEEIYNNCPEILDIDNQIAIQSVRRTKLAILEGSDDLASLRAENEALSQKKRDILVKHGYPSDYLDIKYQCSICKDTGFIGHARCTCFKAAVTKLIYKDSNLTDTVSSENFDNFNYELYSAQPEDRDPVLHLTPRENILKVVNQAQLFIRNFDKASSNLLIYGNTGVGKTYLTNCIAKELLDSAHTVLYYTAFNFFDHMEKIKFHYGDHTDGLVSQDYILTCDLLIIDDLGTELSTQFTAYALYSVINERQLRGKSTIISTNLSFDNLIERYSERVFSRLNKDYTFLKIIGNDIRCL